MNILVTGGAGFIGSNFLHHMAEKYYDDRLICLDALTYAGNLQNLTGILGQPGFRFVKGDIADREMVSHLFTEEKIRFGGIDVVVNFAAESHVDRSIMNPAIFLQTNVIGTQILLDAAREFGVRRFHQVSTDEVYGDLPLERQDLFFVEETPLNPSSPYSASKAAADLLVMAYYKTYQLPVTISRCSNNYGPYHFPEKLIPLIISRAANEKTLPVYGSGNNVRDWLFVRDHCRAIDLIVRQGREGQIYNIGGNCERTNLEVVSLILQKLGKPESLIRFVADRPGHDRRYAIDSSKLRRELGWVPRVNFEDGIAMTIDWYMRNTTWWENIINGEYQNYYLQIYGHG